MKDKRDMNQQEQGVVIREKQRLGVDVKSASSAATAEMNADERDEDINQGNPFFDLPDEMMMSILSHVPLPICSMPDLWPNQKWG